MNIKDKWDEQIHIVDLCEDMIHIKLKCRDVKIGNLCKNDWRIYKENFIWTLEPITCSKCKNN